MPSHREPSATAGRAAIDPADFVSVIDNPFLPLTPGTTYLSTTPDGAGVDTFVVTRQTARIMGVTCVLVHDTTTIDGTLAEKTADFFAQDRHGNVWYFGENTAEYRNGHVVSTEGTWRAGVDDARPGIVMEASPHVGDRYSQENAPDVAQDRAEVVSLSRSVEVPYGSFTGILQTDETTPLEPGFLEHKFYAAGIGVVLSVDTGGGEVEELVEIRLDGTAGADRLLGRSGPDALLGHAGDDGLRGLAGDDTISGGTGDDVIRGGAGRDVLRGGTGQDSVGGDGGRDDIDGGAGADRLSGGADDDFIFGGDGRDVLHGGDGNDSLGGGGGNDALTGGAGRDEIRGGDGADAMRGGTGADTLAGDGGDDRFVFHFAAGQREARGDVVLDFTHGHDRLVFAGYTGGSLAHLAGDTWRLDYADDGPAHETFAVAGITRLSAGVDYQFL